LFSRTRQTAIRLGAPSRIFVLPGFIQESTEILGME
jgi:hypothetical protein